MKIDLDAAKAARREANGEAPTVVFGGKEYELPVELPFEVATSMAGLDEESIKADPSLVGEKINAVVSILFGTSVEEFMGGAPSMNDLMALIEGLSGVYGLDAGESQASAVS